MDLTNVAGGLISVVQSIDIRLGELPVPARVRRGLALLHRLRRFYASDGSRRGFPSALESAEAILACHAVADEGDDTVTESTAEDLEFIEQWWTTLKPLLPPPYSADAKAKEVINLADSGGATSSMPNANDSTFEESHALEVEYTSLGGSPGAE